MGYGRTTLNGIQPAVADVNRFVLSTDMKRTAYTIEATNAMPEANTARHVTITVTFDGAADTTASVLVTGTNLAGQVISETLTPSAVDATTVEGTKWFRTVTAAISASWVIAGAAADHLEVGCGANAIIAEGNGTLHGIQINTTANGVITVSDANGTIAVLPVNVAVGTFYQWDVSWSTWLRVVMAAASDITVMHSGSQLQSYPK
jgi:hypothetical protein